ncbi:hypothetical protein BLOT_013883, partial [Blomia tropicalis]
NNNDDVEKLIFNVRFTLFILFTTTSNLMNGNSHFHFLLNVIFGSLMLVDIEIYMFCGEVTETHKC